MVVAGGHYSDFFDKSTWIYDLDSGLDAWRPGPIHKFYNGASVQFNNTFLTVGGSHNVDPYTYMDQIWEFNADPEDEKWILRPERLKSAKSNVAAFLVPNNYATCEGSNAVMGTIGLVEDEHFNGSLLLLRIWEKILKFGIKRKCQIFWFPP